MNKLIPFERRKLFKSKYFYILTGVSVLLVLIAVISAKLLSNFITDILDQELQVSAYSEAKGALGGTYFYIIAIFVAMFAVEDMSHGTMKNIIAKGFTRQQVYITKYLISLGAVLLMSLITVAVSFFSTLIFWGNSLPIQDNVPLIVLGQLLGVAAYHAMFFAISYSFGKTGPAISVCLLGPIVVSLLLTLADQLLKKLRFEISDYWLSNLHANFTGDTDPSMILPGILLLACYTAVGFLLGMLLCRKKEY